MAERQQHNQDYIISLSSLERCLQQTIARINQTKEPVFVAVRGQAGVAMIDMDEFRELERLADIGWAVEANQRIEREKAEGALVPWEVINEEWKRKIAEWKQEEDG